MTIHYGTNDAKAWRDKCAVTGKTHNFVEKTKNKCFYTYECKDCGSTTSVDSGD